MLAKKEKAHTSIYLPYGQLFQNRIFKQAVKSEFSKVLINFKILDFEAQVDFKL